MSPAGPLDIKPHQKAHDYDNEESVFKKTYYSTPE